MNVTVRPMLEGDLADVDTIFRRAFGTQFRLPDPSVTFGDTDYVHNRFRFKPENAFVAESDGEVVGSVFLTQWGSVAFFGPLTVEPTLWQHGIGKKLMESVVARFAEWKVTHRCLFTFAESAKHVGLYRRFGFWPRFLTCLLAREIQPPKGTSSYRQWSKLTEAERSAAGQACRSLTDRLYPGLDARNEIDMVQKLSLGDTILLDDDAGSGLAGLAVCHFGAKTEAGSGCCYVKFGAVAKSANSGRHFERLISAVEDFAACKGATRVVCGMNYGREQAMAALNELGFRTETQGVAMHGGNSPGYSLPDVFTIDDWR